jgi:hypothetical protein
MPRPFGLPNDLARPGKYAVCPVIVLLLLACLLRAHPRHNSTDQSSPAWISQRTAFVASALGITLQTTDTPLLLFQREWSVTGHASELELHLPFDAESGRLDDLGIVPDATAPTRMVAPLRTLAEAQQVALHCLHDLQVLPPQSQVALARTAYRTLDGRDWILLWKVRSPGIAAPYRVLTQWQVSTGLPLMITRERD